MSAADRFAEALLRLAARRWPAEVRVEQAREWAAELRALRSEPGQGGVRMAAHPLTAFGRGTISLATATQTHTAASTRIPWLG